MGWKTTGKKITGKFSKEKIHSVKELYINSDISDDYKNDLQDEYRIMWFMW